MGVTELLSGEAAPAERLDRSERLLRALDRRPVDRVPVICTGGSMSAVPSAVVAASGYSLPAAHLDARAMAGLALAAAHITGFESVGVPLCTTVEAESYGAPINLGDADCEARIVREPFASVSDVSLPPVAEVLARGRSSLVVDAVRELKAIAGDLPIIANLVGPVSIAASLVDPMTFMRELRTRPAETAALAEHITDYLIAWSRQLISAGALAIAIHEDTTTPAVIGATSFRRAVAPHLQRLSAAIKVAGGRVLLHMCGALGKTEDSLASLGIDAFIPDASVAPGDLRQRLAPVAIIGNISTFLLHQGQAEAIGRLARRLAGESQVDVLSPTCGMSSATPLANIRAMSEAPRHAAHPNKELSHHV